MKAAVLYETNQPVVVEDIEMEAPKKGEVLLALYRAGVLKLDELISRTYQLEEINEAFNDLLNGEGARGMIQF